MFKQTTIITAITLVSLAASEVAHGQTTRATSNFGSPSAGLGLSGFGSAAGGTSSLTPGVGGGFGATAMDATFGASQFSFPGATTIGGLGGIGGIGGFGGLGGLGALGLGGAGGFAQGLGLGGGFGGRGGFGGGFGQQQQNQTPTVRATVSIGFTYVPPPAHERSTAINDRIARLPLPEGIGDVKIELQGRTAIIRGQVATDDDGKLVERLLSLEPGISSVDNQLVVGALPIQQ